MKLLKSSAFVVFLLVGQAALPAQGLPPTIDPPDSWSVREGDWAQMIVRASDEDTPQSDLVYTWTITSDPTGNAFFRQTDGTEPDVVTGPSSALRLALTVGPNYPAPSFVGQTIDVRVDVSDGENTVGVDIPVPVVGVNQRPVLRVDTNQLGTQDDPRLTGEGLGLDARASSDPDGTSVKVLWQVVGLANGQECTPGSLVLFGKETYTPGFPVPRVTARPGSPMTVTIEALVEDGLIFFSERFIGYMASPNGCSGGGGTTPPLVINSLSALPPTANFGQTVALSANAPDGLSYTWVQLGTTGTSNQVNLSGDRTRNATFVAPSASVDLRFQFTVSDGVGSVSSSITVPVRQGGGGGGNPPPSGDTGTPTGTATGQTVCSQSGNQPAVATVPARFTIDGGNVASITASNGRDPDNTQVFVNGIVASGVAYLWRVANGGGVLNPSALSGINSATVRVSTPSVSQNRTAFLEMTISDAANCGTSYQVELVMTPAPATPNNSPPSARLQFQVTGEIGTVEALGQTLTLTSPAEVTLDARNSTDSDGTLSFGFSLQKTLSRGSALLSPVSEGVQRLVIAPDTLGTVRVDLTVTDNGGASDTVSISFVIEDEAEIPTAAAMAQVNGVQLQPGDSVEEGTVVTLDGSSSALPDGSQPPELTYSWRQTSGPPVNILNADTVLGMFRAPETPSGSAQLVFELIVGNGNASSVPVQVGVSVAVPPLFFSQVAFGPLLDEHFRTVIVLINNTDDEASDVTIGFFGPQGAPLAVQLDGDLWDPALPLFIGPSSSVILPFAALDDSLTVGWGRVDSSVRLTGLVLYQLVDVATGELNSEVSLFSSRQGSRFTTFYGVRDGLAAALANPGTEEARVNIKIIDPLLGPDLPLATKPVILQPGQHLARFLNETYFGALPEEFQDGTIIIEAVQGRVIATVLKTQGGVAISTLPLAVRR